MNSNLRRRIAYARGLSREAGMTLVEVIVVIAIVLALTSILAFGVFTVFGQAKADTAKLEIARLESRVQIYIARTGNPPTTSEGLAAALAPEDVPTDPWGSPYRYVTPGPSGQPYDIVSLGSDKAEGGTGDASDLRLSGL